MALFHSNKQKLLSDSYQAKIESIDDIKIGRLFQEKVESEKYSVEQTDIERLSDFQHVNLRTKLNEQQVKELAIKFFKIFNDPKAREAIKIIKGKSKKIKIDIAYGKISNGGLDAPDKQKNELKMKCDFVGDIQDLYVLVHETTHTQDISNGDTISRRILGEVSPQCMEDILDDFLINLKDKEKYGINNQTLKEDIRDRKIMRFISRYHNVIGFNKSIERRKRDGSTEKDLRYMLAQIYQSKFSQLDFKTKKAKIFKFIRCVERNEFEKANSTLGINFQNNMEQHINDAVKFIKSLLPPKKFIDNYKVACGGSTQNMNAQEKTNLIDIQVNNGRVNKDVSDD